MDDVSAVLLLYYYFKQFVFVVLASVRIKVNANLRSMQLTSCKISLHFCRQRPLALREIVACKGIARVHLLFTTNYWQFEVVFRFHLDILHVSTFENKTCIIFFARNDHGALLQ